MRGRSADAAGFSLIEVIISMVILGIIAIAMLPALINGIRYSSEQASVATATRQLNAIVEEARRAPSCANLATARATKTFTDGSGRDFTTSGSSGSCTPCPILTGAAISLTLAATQSGRTLATVSAKVYVPGAKAGTTCS